MGESTKIHEENSNLIREIRASTDAAIRNQRASIKTLEIQIGPMSKVLQERGFGSLPSSTKTNMRDHVKSILTTVEVDASSIRRIGSHQYAVSTGHNSTLMYETRQTTILFLSRLNDCHYEEKKGLYGLQFSEAYSYGASHIDKSIPRKEKDPGSFTLPCYINNVCFDNALADLGASVSVMPLSTYLNLGLGELAHTKLTVELADRTVKYLKGIAENVLVGIGKFIFPLDFIILDMPEDVKVPLILGRPFLSTAHAKIDVFKRKITLRVGEEKIIFKSVKPASSLIKRVYMLSLRERMELDLKARLMRETLVLNRSLDPLFGDYIELNDLNVPLELRRDQVDDLMPTIEEGEVVEEFRAKNDAIIFCSFRKYGCLSCEGMGDVIFGEPFLREADIKAKRFKGMITLYKGDDEVTYQMVRSHPRFKHHTNEQCNKIPPLLKLKEKDVMNGVSHAYQKLKGFYKGVLNLGSDYIRNAKTEEWLTRGHISVHEYQDRNAPVFPIFYAGPREGNINEYWWRIYESGNLEVLEMALPAQNINHSAFRLMFEREKLSKNNFNDWFHQLKLVLRVEKKMYVIEQPLPAAPAADSQAQVLSQWNAVYDAYNEVACLILGKEGKPVAAYVLQMKGYVDQLERLSYMLPQDLIVGLILNGLTKDFSRFMRNYNMHNMGKTIGELHAMLIEYEKGLPKKAETPQVMMNKGGKIQKSKKKSLKAKGKGKANGKGKDKQVYIPKPSAKSTQLRMTPAATTRSKKRIENLQQEGLLKSTDDESFDQCISCLSRKMTRKSFPHRPERATDLLGIIHIDVFKNEVENQLRKTIKALRSDRGGKYISQEFKDYLKACGIIQQLTPPYTPQHNGMSERRNHTLLDMMTQPIQNINHSAFRSMFEREKFSRNNFNDWFRQLKLVLRVEKKIFFIKQPLPAAPAADSNAQVLSEWNAIYDAHNELKAMFEKQAGVERNYNMHNIGKKVGELHAMLIEYEKGLPKKAETSQVMMIKVGKIQKANNKSLKVKGKGKANGKGKDKQVYIPKPSAKSTQLRMTPAATTRRKTIKALRSDRGGKYISQEFKDYLKACGIIQQLTPPYTPQHNVMSERRNHTLLDMVRSMMNLTTLPLSFWDYALESTTRILNMVLTKKVDKTLYELWYGKVPNFSYLKVWGCEALVKRDMPDKLQQRSVKCVFIGYSKETMCYYFYFPPENKIVVARYAEFFEKNLITQEVSGRAKGLEEIQDEDTSPFEITNEIPMEVEGFKPPQEEVILIR
ncbi:retrovirus-related pol polyprotein from transposon TNT 1-94 [Tanacetum coccineum]|uniref:Retrovirus-related pol polyprotein from transposon TNT 1-94 n=1 Tax=Tanacetum coccineum TaxID=301880 RepID=A0ABQ4Y9X9_9ASTR